MRRIAPPITATPVAASRASWFDSLRLWRGVAAAAAMAAVLALYVASRPVPAPVVVAILNDQNGQPSWIATLNPGKAAFAVAAIGPQEIATATSLELWMIAGGEPRSLGLLAAQPNKPLVLSTGELPPEGGVLAVSLEPAGGSPTGQPTGPVLFQGKILAHSL